MQESAKQGIEYVRYENQKFAIRSQAEMIVILLIVFSFLFQEWSYAVMKGVIWVRVAGKLATSGLIVLLGLLSALTYVPHMDPGRSQNPEFFFIGDHGFRAFPESLRILGLAFYMFADAALIPQVKMGLILFSFGHLCMTAFFLSRAKEKVRGEKISDPFSGRKRAFLVWLFASAVLFALLFLTGSFWLSEQIASWILPGAGYILSLLAALCFSFSAGKKWAVGAVLFVISDLVLVFNYMTGLTLPRHVLAAGLYYAAVTLLAFPFSGHEQIL